LVESHVVSPQDALVAPAVFLYFIFIILSTLRLSPGLSLATGFLSAVGYVAVVFYVRENYGFVNDGASILPFRYLLYASLVLAGGIAATIVASQIKQHVYGALREAELQHELDRVNHDLDVARSIQQDLLPDRTPDLCGFEVAGWNRPADQTGGDYFDWQTLPDGRIAVSLADATGHGIGPALVSASCRAYARATLLSGKSDGLLENLNQLLSEDLPQNRFVTFAVVFLDPNCPHVRVLSAGHGPILWYKHDTGKIENIEAQGIPLGMIDGFTYGKAAEARMAAGDILALITDGFYEWEDPEGEQFGLSRLEDVIHKARDCTAAEMILNLRSAVESFCKGTKQQDDLTAVILKRCSD
jgi:serine phosphatase RsbU (regulator of sigma subunit)